MRLSENSSMLPGIKLLICLFAVTAVLQLTPASGAIYKWTNSTGEVQYTQMRPPRGITAEIIEGAPPPADDPTKLRRDIQQQLDKSDEQATAKDEVKSKKQQQAEIKEIYKKNCISSRDNLAKLQLGGSVRFVTDDGEAIRLTEEERQQRISEAEKNISKFCSPEKK